MAERPTVTVTLKDGSKAFIRPIQIDDTQLCLQMLRSLSHETIYNRYFVFRDTLSYEEAAKMTCVSYKDEVALVALAEDQGETKMIGDARIYIHGDKGEIGIVVQDRWQNRGLGTFLLTQLIEEGRERELKNLSIYCLPDNVVMKHVAQKVGFRLKSSEIGIATLEIDL